MLSLDNLNFPELINALIARRDLTPGAAPETWLGGGKS